MRISVVYCVLSLLSGYNCRGLQMMPYHSRSIDDIILYHFIHIFILRIPEN